MAEQHLTPKFLYVATNTQNGKQYVGQTQRSVAERWRHHLKRVGWRKPQCPALYKAITKYGSDAFVVAAIELGCISQAELDQAERNLIAGLNTIVPNGYNLGAGGFGHGPLHPETKSKLRALNLGKTLTLEQRAKMSAARMGHVVTEETRAKIRASNKARPPTSEEVRLKMREGQANRKPLSPEASAKLSAKLSAAFKGRVFTPEWCAKISAAKKGKPNVLLRGRTRPPEVIAKCSATNKETYARRWAAGEVVTRRGKHYPAKTGQQGLFDK